MISGGCPYCDAPHLLACPDRTPAYALITCDECHCTFWMRFSVWDPEAYTLVEFYDTYVIDYEARTITKK